MRRVTGCSAAIRAVSHAARTADGRLWFATSAGVAAIDPKHLPCNLAPPLITIEAVKADDHALETSAGIQLPPQRETILR
jgi:hypothetical protein